jgi:hypothetical protein
MLSAQTAIHRYQRDVALGWIVRVLLVAALLASVLVLPFMFKRYEAAFGFAAVFGIWMMLSITSAKNSRLLAPSPELIARGEFEEAEQRIDQAMRAFSLSRTSKLLGLHHLAALRHKQKNFQDVAKLCRVVLGQRPNTTMPGLDRATRLMLADTLLELDDVRGAADVIAPLRMQQLPLHEQLSLLYTELDVQLRMSAWDAMLAGLPFKVQLAEMMPPAHAARIQAMLALAARHRGLPDWADWLRQRVELLADVDKLATERPALWELWQK